jgi:hypothetical protein
MVVELCKEEVYGEKFVGFGVCLLLKGGRGGNGRGAMMETRRGRGGSEMRMRMWYYERIVTVL